MRVLLSAPSKHNSAHPINCASDNSEGNSPLVYESTRLLRLSRNSSAESGPARARGSGNDSATRGGRVMVAISSFPWFRNHVNSNASARRSAHRSSISAICFRLFAWSANRLSMASSRDRFEAVIKKSTAINSSLSDTFTIPLIRPSQKAGVEGLDTNTQVANVRTTCFREA
jgi:hypothetical protein